jgi:hypothetical protein
MNLTGKSLNRYVLAREADLISPADIQDVFDDGVVIKRVSAGPADFGLDAGFQVEIGVQNWGKYNSQIDGHSGYDDQEHASN